MAQVDSNFTRPLPPGVSADDLESAIVAFRDALGDERVLTSQADLRTFRDPFAHEDWDAFTASAVVQPVTVEEVQAVVRIANEHRVPLWTHGQGRNNGYGGPAPRLRGSVIVSLREMNKVLEINEELAYAVVEPGVRWFDLYEAIQAGDHGLMLSIADLGWGSVMGNTLDNGVTYMPYGVDMGMWCGLEVVLPNGELLRTGMGAMEDNKAFHLYKRSLGPSLDTLFTQSNYGIVTRMGVWLMREPEVYMPLWLKTWKESDLGEIMEVLRELMLDGTIRMVPQVMNTMLLAGVLSKRADWHTGDEPIPDDVIDHIARELDIGRWCMRFALYGDEAVVDHRFAKIKQAFESRIEGAEVTGTKGSPKDIASLEHPAERIQGGVPDLEWNNMTAWYGGAEDGGHIGFSPVVALTGRDADAAHKLLRGMIEEAGLDYICGLLAINARCFVNIVMVIFDTSNEEQSKAAYDVAKRLVVEAAKQGLGEYRAHLDFMDQASEQYAFGDHAYRGVVETIKDALDPNGILSPGKQGIWPAGLRDAARAGEL